MANVLHPAAGASLRVLLLLLAVGLLNSLDLTLTLREGSTPFFRELNPVAAPLFELPTGWIAAFKAGLVAVAFAILWKLRMHRVAERACWALYFAYLGVALTWSLYFFSIYAELGSLAAEVRFPAWYTTGP